MAVGAVGVRVHCVLGLQRMKRGHSPSSFVAPFTTVLNLPQKDAPSLLSEQRTFFSRWSELSYIYIYILLYNRVFNCFKQHVYYVSINSFIYNVSKNNFLECSTCLQ